MKKIATLKTSEVTDLLKSIKTSLGVKTFYDYSNYLSISPYNDILLVKTYPTNSVCEFALECENLDTEFKEVTVSAETFINMLLSMTSEAINIFIEEENGSKNVVVKGDGTFVFATVEGITVPNIHMKQEAEERILTTEQIRNILTFNKSVVDSEYALDIKQKQYYFTKDNCFTFSSGACSTPLNFEDDFDLILSNDVINLFKIFNDNVDKVFITIGYDDEDQKIIIANCDDISFITHVAITDSLKDIIPINAIRERLEKEYDTYFDISVKSFLSTLNRIKLINKEQGLPVVLIKVNSDSIEVSDVNEASAKEIVSCTGAFDEEYSMKLELNQLYNIINSYSTDTIRIAYGDNTAILITDEEKTIRNIMPESRLI